MMRWLWWWGTILVFSGWGARLLLFRSLAYRLYGRCFLSCRRARRGRSWRTGCKWAAHIRRWRVCRPDRLDSSLGAWLSARSEGFRRSRSNPSLELRREIKWLRWLGQRLCFLQDIGHMGYLLIISTIFAYITIYYIISSIEWLLYEHRV